jgi:hypothetical protein
MKSLYPTRNRAALSPGATPRTATLLQRKCACGQHTGGGECEECKKKNMPLQRHPDGSMAPTTAPTIVHDVLRSPGHPLDHATRAFMEPRFGADFSQVRVHSDAKAAESAETVSALAYTVGRDVVFNRGQFSPESLTGRQLLAHELTHVVQQGLTVGHPVPVAHSAAEGEAQNNSQRIASGEPTQVRTPVAAGIHRQQDPNPVDDKAKAIIAKAKDTTKGLDQRAKDAVMDILKTYYDTSKVSEVVYDESDPGLTTSPVGTGQAIKGSIAVGRYFVEHIESFARRVLQVGHELQHVDQQRGGLGGEGNKDKREFQAFSWEAQAQERTGTGRLPYAMRRDLIDSALGYFNCLSGDDQKTFAADRDKLLKLREDVNGKGGNPSTNPPAECKRQASRTTSQPPNSSPPQSQPSSNPEKKSATKSQLNDILEPRYRGVLTG